VTRQEALLAVSYLALHDADWIRYEGIHDPKVTEEQIVEMLSQAEYLYDLSQQIYTDAAGNDVVWRRAVRWTEGEGYDV
jgi:hypothetical protein